MKKSMVILLASIFVSAVSGCASKTCPVVKEDGKACDVKKEKSADLKEKAKDIKTASQDEKMKKKMEKKKEEMKESEEKVK